MIGFKGWTKDTYTAEANPYETKTEEAKPEEKPEKPDETKDEHLVNAGGQ